MNTEAVKAELRQLADQARVVVDNGSLSTAQKQALLDDLEKKINAKQAELDGEAHLADQRRRLFGAADIQPRPLAAGTKAFGVTRPGTVGAAPAIAFDDSQMLELFDAVVSGKACTIEAKAVGETQAPMATIPDFRLPPVPFRREPTRVANLIPTSATDASEVDYYQFTTAATAAAAVAEGSAKPQSNPVWAKVAAPIVKIAHYVEVTDETLSDFPGFVAVMQEELMAGLVLAESAQLLSGSGVAPNMLGLLNTTGILTRARGTDTQIDALFKSLTDLRAGTSYIEADGIVLNPADWQTVVTSKDTQGRYLIDAVESGPTPTLWGKKVVVTTQIAAGTALVGSFAEGAQLFTRWAPRIDTANQGTTQFVNNTTLIRCEERLGLAVTRPTAFVKVTGL